MKFIAEYFLFRVFETVEQYRAAHGGAGFASEKPVKRWFDPSAGADGDDVAVYDVVKFRDGKPFIGKLLLSAEEARTVNIPPTGYQGPRLPERPVPLKPLGADEYVAQGAPGMPGMGLMVMKRGEQPPTPQPGDVFTAEDRRKLDAIYRKVVGEWKVVLNA